MKKIIQLTLYLLCFSFVPAHAQTCSPDAASKYYDEGETENYLNELYCLLNQNSKEALEYAYPRILLYHGKENPDSVTIYYERAKEVIQSFQFNEESRMYIETAYAMYLMENGYYTQSLAFFQEYENKVDEYDIANTFYDQYAKLNYYLEDMPKAFTFLKKSLRFCETDECLSTSFNNIGILYKNNNQPDSAIVYHQKSLGISLEKKDSLAIAQSYNNIAITHYSYRNLLEAEKFFQLAYEANPQNPTESLMTNYSKLFIEQGKFNKAEDFLTTVLSKEINPNLKIEVLQELVYLEESRNNLVKALYYERQKSRIKEDLNSKARINEIERLKIEHETEQKEIEIQILNEKNNAISKRNQIIIVIGSILIGFILLAGILFLRTRNVKAQIKEISLEQRLLRSQMNPHFIFNSLGAIQSFIIEDKPREASSYLAKFSKLIRVILDNSTSSFVPFDTELTAIEHYLKLQQLRFDSFVYSIQVDKELELATDYLIPPMLFQPFVENAVEHGLRPRANGGKIDIQFKLEANRILCTIQDNGVGRRASMKTAKGKPSLSTGITKERLQILGNTSNNALQIIDLYNKNNEPMGTKVILQIPFKLSE